MKLHVQSLYNTMRFETFVFLIRFESTSLLFKVLQIKYTPFKYLQRFDQSEAKNLRLPTNERWRNYDSTAFPGLSYSLFS